MVELFISGICSRWRVLVGLGTCLFIIYLKSYYERFSSFFSSDSGAFVCPISTYEVQEDSDPRVRSSLETSFILY